MPLPITQIANLKNVVLTLRAAWPPYWYYEDGIAYDGVPVPVPALPIPDEYDGDARGPEESDKSDGNQQSQKIRTEFRETWLWSNYVSE